MGGGTPSELSASELERLLCWAQARFAPAVGWGEATVEGNPESMDSSKLSALRRAGAGRLSLGLQATQDRLLKAVGRRHTWEDFLRVYREAAGMGFDLSVDLMFGLPGQSRADARESLARALDLEPGHLSLYSLQVEDRTLFGKREVEVDEDLAREVMEESIDILEASGYRHYEISNFALPGKESLHNLNYWNDGEYLGLGCGAAGHLGGERWQNEDRLSRYLEKAEGGKSPRASAESLSGREKLGETLMLGLRRRLDGVSAAGPEAGAFEHEIEGLLGRGLLERAEERLRLSREGVFLANEVFRQFVPPFPAAPETNHP